MVQKLGNAASKSLHKLQSRIAMQQTLPWMVRGSSGSNTTSESLQELQAELPYKRHCPEWFREACDCSIRKAYGNCNQNCLPKDIAWNGMGKLRVKYNIRKLTGIAIQKTLHWMLWGRSGLQHQKSLQGLQAELWYKRHCPEGEDPQGWLQHQKAYRNCQKNCPTNDIVSMMWGKLRVKCSIRKAYKNCKKNFPTKDIMVRKLRVLNCSIKSSSLETSNDGQGFWAWTWTLMKN